MKQKKRWLTLIAGIAQIVVACVLFFEITLVVKGLWITPIPLWVFWGVGLVACMLLFLGCLNIWRFNVEKWLKGK